MSRLGHLGSALYRGEVSYDFVSRRRRWYAISGVILLFAIGGLVTRGLNFGVEFEGGAVFVSPKTSASVQDARDAVSGIVPGEPIVTKEGTTNKIRVQTEALVPAQTQEVQNALSKALDVPSGEIQTQVVGPSWGGEITKKAFTGLGVFLLLVIIYLSLAFEPKMAISAVVALLHDLVITVGVYAAVGFDVTPATVIGLLTILGYSLYDTVVVFDKVKENTRGLAGGARMTYSQAANLALNQTLVRSINTTVVALLPVGAILFVGAGFLGAGVLKDLSLALFVGLAAGAYSSIFIATPLLAHLKEREPAMMALRKRIESRAGRPARTPAVVGAGATALGASPRQAADRDQQLGASDGRPAPDAGTPEPPVVAKAAAGRGGGQRPASGARQQPRKGGSKSSRSGSNKRPSKKRR